MTFEQEAKQLYKENKALERELMRAREINSALRVNLEDIQRETRLLGKNAEYIQCKEDPDFCDRLISERYYFEFLLDQANDKIDRLYKGEVW